MSDVYHAVYNYDTNDGTWRVEDIDGLIEAVGLTEKEAKDMAEELTDALYGDWGD